MSMGVVGWGQTYKHVAESFSVLLGGKYLVKKICVPILIYLVSFNVSQIQMIHNH